MCAFTKQKVFLEFAFLFKLFPSRLLSNSLLFLPQNADDFISSVWRFPKSTLGSSNVVCIFFSTKWFHLYIWLKYFLWWVEKKDFQMEGRRGGGGNFQLKAKTRADIKFLKESNSVLWQTPSQLLKPKREQKMFCLVNFVETHMGISPSTNSWGLSENVKEDKLVGLVPWQKLALTLVNYNK